MCQGAKNHSDTYMKLTSLSLEKSADLLTKNWIFAEEKGPSLPLYSIVVPFRMLSISWRYVRTIIRA